MKAIETKREDKYISPELEVVNVVIESGIMETSQTEQIIDEPEDGM